MIDLSVPSDAVECGPYRYSLSRQWGDEKPAIFIMLNPSTADAYEDDPTIRKCVRFAKRWQCGGLVVVNLFAHRATATTDLFQADQPIGPDNRCHIAHAVRMNGFAVCAWGEHDKLEKKFRNQIRDQGNIITAYIKDIAPTLQLKSLGLLSKKYCHPKHPLYLPIDTKLQPYAT